MLFQKINAQISAEILNSLNWQVKTFLSFHPTDSEVKERYFSVDLKSDQRDTHPTNSCLFPSIIEVTYGARPTYALQQIV
jgi:hypothetical protein